MNRLVQSLMSISRIQLLIRLLTVAICVKVSSPLLAHPGHSHGKSKSTSSSSTPARTARVWTITRDTNPARGSFVMARDGVVQIRQDDDTLLTLPLDRLSLDDQRFVEQRLQAIRAAVQRPILLAQLDRGEQRSDAAQKAPLIASHFDPFVKLKSIRTRWDHRYFYVESNGIPAHQMMIGITAWQQQVPIPQAYSGDNAWQIPLHPVPAKTPATTKDRFLRGAIALAVNGIPIFNPLNNRGDDAYLFGELDEYGGHCGRADDYHYHIAPVHLQETVGKDQPIAYALDGYPIYGYQEEKSPDFAPLDKLNGHKDRSGNYHYHATKTYPYLNGGFYGEVVDKDGQVDPQPRANGLRSALPPMQGAKITGYEEVRPGTFRLTYDVRGKTGSVTYTLSDSGSAKFEFVDTAGRTTTENYTPRGGGGGRGDENSRPPRRGRRRPPMPTDDRPQASDEPRRPNQPTGGQSSPATAKVLALKVSSSSLDEKGHLLLSCTCDGDSESPAVAWTGAPGGTKSFAVSLWHTAQDQEKSYWLVYNIPANVKQLAQNSKGIGTLGQNGKRRAEYDPMCSKGPGLKTYHITVFALSEELKLDPANADRAQLLEAVRGITLAEGTLDYLYERKVAN